MAQDDHPALVTVSGEKTIGVVHAFQVLASVFAGRPQEWAAASGVMAKYTNGRVTVEDATEAFVVASGVK